MVVKNDIYWCEIGSGFEEPGGRALPRIPRSTPPAPARYYGNFIDLIFNMKISVPKKINTVTLKQSKIKIK